MAPAGGVRAPVGTCCSLSMLKWLSRSSGLVRKNCNSLWHQNFVTVGQFESDIWATAWQNQQNDMCAQQRLRSAWASAALADLSLRWAHRSFCWIFFRYLKSTLGNIQLINKFRKSNNQESAQVRSSFGIPKNSDTPKMFFNYPYI